MLHPSACALFGYPYTETNRFVKPIFDNALRTFLAFDIYRYGTPCRLSHLGSILALRNRSLCTCPSCRQIFLLLILLATDIYIYKICNRERNRWQMKRNIANCEYR